MLCRSNVFKRFLFYWEWKCTIGAHDLQQLEHVLWLELNFWVELRWCWHVVWCLQLEIHCPITHQHTTNLIWPRIVSHLWVWHFCVQPRCELSRSKAEGNQPSINLSIDRCRFLIKKECWISRKRHTHTHWKVDLTIRFNQKIKCLVYCLNEDTRAVCLLQGLEERLFFLVGTNQSCLTDITIKCIQHHSTS